MGRPLHLKVEPRFCAYDPRNPDYVEAYMDPGEERPQYDPKEDCSCDNCFYGRTVLSLELLRLRKQNARLWKTIYRLNPKKGAPTDG